MHEDSLLYSPVILTDAEVEYLFPKGVSGTKPISLSPNGLRHRVYIDPSSLTLLLPDWSQPSVRMAEAEDPPSPAAHGAKFGEPVKAAVALSGQDSRTTVMFRRVPRRLSQDDLRRCIESIPGMQSSVEFLYLPRDVARRSNRGFAFVNFNSCTQLGLLASLLSVDGSPSQLPSHIRNCQMYYARIQGQGAELQVLIDQRQFDNLISHSTPHQH